MIFYDILGQLNITLIQANEFVSLTTIFEHDHVEYAQKHNLNIFLALLKLKKIGNNKQIMRCLFNNMSFSLKLFVENKKYMHPKYPQDVFKYGILNTFFQKYFEFNCIHILANDIKFLDNILSKFMKKLAGT